jgi:hypothetical protein
MGMIFNIITTCVIGFVYLLLLLIYTNDIDEVLNSPYSTAAIAVLVNALGNLNMNIFNIV